MPDPDHRLVASGAFLSLKGLLGAFLIQTPEPPGPVGIPVPMNPDPDPGTVAMVGISVPDPPIGIVVAPAETQILLFPMGCGSLPSPTVAFWILPLPF